MPYKKEEQNEYNRAYKLANAERLKELAREYNAKPEVKARKKEYNKQYRLAQKENPLKEKPLSLTKEYRHSYYLANIDTLKQKSKEYCAKPEVKARRKAYNSQPAQKEQKREYRKKNHKEITIYSWKRIGLLEAENFTFDQIYDMYLECKTCDDCNKDLTGTNAAGKRLVHMEHCHVTGNFRGFVCNQCNQKRAVKDKFDNLDKNNC